MGGMPAPGGLVETPPGTAAGGTHPIGMHSCFQWTIEKIQK